MLAPRLDGSSKICFGMPASTASIKMKEDLHEPLVMKEKATQQLTNNGTTRPKNPPANLRPTEGYILEVDGKFKSEYKRSEAAMKVGIVLDTLSKVQSTKGLDGEFWRQELAEEGDYLSGTC